MGLRMFRRGRPVVSLLVLIGMISAQLLQFSHSHKHSALEATSLSGSSDHALAHRHGRPHWHPHSATHKLTESHHKHHHPVRAASKETCLSVEQFCLGCEGTNDCDLVFYLPDLTRDELTGEQRLTQHRAIESVIAASTPFDSFEMKSLWCRASDNGKPLSPLRFYQLLSTRC